VCDDVVLPRQEQPKIHPLTPEQAQLLLQKMKDHPLEVLLTLTLATGMRKGEILGLRWADVDLEKGTLHVAHTLNYIARYGFVEGEPKTQGSKRTILLPQFVIEALRRHRTAQLEVRLMAGALWVDHDLVFCNKQGGFIVHTTLLYHFSKLLKEAGLPQVRFHDLRHSAATLLLSMGVPAKVVQELLGHSRIGMTLDTYSHVLPAMQKDAADKMEGFLRQQL
jgi:integrase